MLKVLEKYKILKLHLLDKYFSNYTHLVNKIFKNTYLVKNSSYVGLFPKKKNGESWRIVFDVRRFILCVAMKSFSTQNAEGRWAWKTSVSNIVDSLKNRLGFFCFVLLGSMWTWKMYLNASFSQKKKCMELLSYYSDLVVYLNWILHMLIFEWLNLSKNKILFPHN